MAPKTMLHFGLLLGVLCSFGPMACSAGALANSFLGRKFLRVQEVKRDIEEMSIFGGSRVAEIEVGMVRTFRALPKNTAGRLAPRAVRYIIQTYVSKEHGWMIKGLETQGMQTNVTDVSEATIFQEQAPAIVEALLESKQTQHGLSLRDVAVIVAVLERLIFHDQLAVLEGCYGVNGISSDAAVDKGMLHEILQTYLLALDAGHGNFDPTDVSLHQAQKAQLFDLAISAWTVIIEFEQDAVGNFDYARRNSLNPFAGPKYSFQVVSEILQKLSQDYGKWQNQECRMMRDALIALQPDRDSGLVPLKLFYSHPDDADYTFTENPQYLREIGAMEVSTSGVESVRIVNYVHGPSNCMTVSPYYFMCCMSDCSGIMEEIEGLIQGPTAQPRQLLGFIANLSSPTLDGPRELPLDMVDRLHRIADQHKGEVHLHGRLFAQWLHYAFPNDCPYPHIAKNASVMSPIHWLNENSTLIIPVTTEEKRFHEIAEDSETFSMDLMSPANKWIDEEILPLIEPQLGRGGQLSSILRFAVMLVLCVGVGQTARKTWAAIKSSADDGFLSTKLHPRQTKAVAVHYV